MRAKLLLLLLSATLGACQSVNQSIMQATPQVSSVSGDRVMAVKSKVAFVNALDFSGDGRFLVSGGVSQSLWIWDVFNAGTVRKIRFTPTYGTTDVALSRDGKLVAASGMVSAFTGGERTTLWNAGTGEEQCVVDEPFGRPLSFSHDGKILLGTITMAFSETPYVKLVDTRSCKVLRQFEGYNAGSISPDGKHVALANRKAGVLALVELNTGEEIWRARIGRASEVVFSPDRKTLLVLRSETRGMLDTGKLISVVVVDAASGNLTRELVRQSVESNLMGFETAGSSISHIAVSPDGKFVLGGNTRGEYALWEIATGALIRKFSSPDESSSGAQAPSQAAFSPNGRLIATTSAGSVKFFDMLSGEETASMIAFEDGEWLIATPNGYFNASERGDQYLDVRVGGKAYSRTQLRESFFRPELVKVALSGGSLQEFRKLDDIRQPPAVAIVDTPNSAAQDQIAVTLEIIDQGGGVGEVRLYRNGSAVALNKGRNLQVAPAGEGRRLLRHTISLEPGLNSIRAVAFNGDNTMQSADARIEIQAAFAPRPPALHAIVVGIKDYINPRLALTYPVADADLFASTLENRSKPLFSSVRVQRLVKPEETTSLQLAAALRRAQAEVRPEDLFVFYVASHGTVDNGQYYLITSNVGSTSSARLQQDALSQDVLKELIANIPASKKLIVLDTCNAGKLGDVLQVAMLTRGMSDDTAMKVLSRAVGSTVLAAATSVQEALEGYRGHGLFTWAIVEGLNGAADADRDGYVKTLELADYVDNQVPDLAEKVFHHKQFPIVSPSGQGFPLTRTK